MNELIESWFFSVGWRYLVDDTSFVLYKCCLLIAERAQPAGRMQAAVRSGHLRDGRQDPAVAGPRAMLQHTYGQCL